MDTEKLLGAMLSAIGTYKDPASDRYDREHALSNAENLALRIADWAKNEQEKLKKETENGKQGSERS